MKKSEHINYIKNQWQGEQEVPGSISVYNKPSFTGGKGYYTTHSCYSYTAESAGDTLIVNIFSKRTRVFTLFMDRYTFITYCVDGKTSNAMIDNLNGLGYQPKFYPLENADSIISDHFRVNGWSSDIGNLYYSYSRGIDSIILYQRTIRANQLEKKHDRIRRSIDSAMLEIRPVTKASTEWCRKYVSHHCIFYRSGEKTGICSRCGKAVPLRAAKHHGKQHCPYCRKDFEAIRSGAYKSGKSSLSGERCVWYLQKRKNGGMIMRLFRIYFSFRKGCKTPGSVRITDEWYHSVSLSEIGRYFINADGVYSKGYEFGDVSGVNEFRWRIANNYSGRECMTFPKAAETIKSAFPEFRYMPLKQLMAYCDNIINPHYFLNTVERFPFLEYTEKLSMKKLTKEIITRRAYNTDKVLNRHGKNIAEIFGVPKSCVKELVSMDPDLNEVKIFQWIKRNRRSCTVAEIDAFTRYIPTDAVLLLLEYQSPEKLAAYIGTQTRLNYGDHPSAHDISRMYSDYHDYIADCIALGHNLEDTAVLNPHDLEAAHTDRNEQGRYAKYREDGKKYAETLSARAVSLEWLSYTNGKYTISPVASVDELCRESEKLHHCVGSYARKYADGTCTILVVRRSDDQDRPFVTLELNNKMDAITQVRGFRNCTPDEEVRRFCTEWLAKIPEFKEKNKKAC